MNTYSGTATEKFESDKTRSMVKIDNAYWFAGTAKGVVTLMEPRRM